MEKKVKKGRGLRVFIALGVMCMLLMGLAVQAGAADSEPASGNLTMTLTVCFPGTGGCQVPGFLQIWIRWRREIPLS